MTLQCGVMCSQPKERREILRQISEACRSNESFPLESTKSVQFYLHLDLETLASRTSDRRERKSMRDGAGFFKNNFLLLFSCSIVSLCDPIDCRSGFPVFHHLLKFVQIQVH